MELRHYVFCMKDLSGYGVDYTYKHVFHYTEEMAKLEILKTANTDNWKFIWIEDKGPVKPGLSLTGKLL